MGQQPSTQNPSQPQRPPPSRRTSSNLVRPQHRKKSLELPEFAALTAQNNQQHPPFPSPRLPQPSNAIDIPMAATVFQQPPSPPHSKAHYFPPPPMRSHAHQPYPPNVQPSPSHHHPDPQPQPQRESSRSSAPSSSKPQSSRPAVAKEDALLVRSKLPTGLPRPSAALADAPTSDDEQEGMQEATITWRGQAKEVYLTGVSEKDRQFTVKMVHEPGSKSTFFATLRLPPGTHPLRFIVDDHYRCTDTLPTATDVDGTFINYIEIPSPSHSPSQSRSMPANGWEAGGAVSVLAGGPSAQGSSSSSKQMPVMEWTDQIPPRLFQLAAAEEQYLAARAAAAQNPPSVGRHGSTQYPPLPPPPPVPYPPSLPRHLEKVILNSSSSRNAASFTPAILASHESARPRIIGTGTTGPLIPPSGPRPRAKGIPGVPTNGVSLGGAGGQQQQQQQIPVGVPTNGGILISGTGGGEGAGDDNSVLPVPNHVVLNHLGTSAIKNGVLAVGTTTRYHRKYISTIYYKPI
ncbi:hypothetical protein FRC04_006371 [Tulasnella sp. 424]|nr:hypothetical protein FRC04_006371 [Tulasnella sp. 424]